MFMALDSRGDERPGSILYVHRDASADATLYIHIIKTHSMAYINLGISRLLIVVYQVSYHLFI